MQFVDFAGETAADLLFGRVAAECAVGILNRFLASSTVVSAENRSVMNEQIGRRIRCVPLDIGVSDVIAAGSVVFSVGYALADDVLRLSLDAFNSDTLDLYLDADLADQLTGVLELARQAGLS